MVVLITYRMRDPSWCEEWSPRCGVSFVNESLFLNESFKWSILVNYCTTPRIGIIRLLKSLPFDCTRVFSHWLQHEQVVRTAKECFIGWIYLCQYLGRVEMSLYVSQMKNSDAKAVWNCLLKLGFSKTPMFMFSYFILIAMKTTQHDKNAYFKWHLEAFASELFISISFCIFYMPIFIFDLL